MFTLEPQKAVAILVSLQALSNVNTPAQITVEFLPIYLILKIQPKYSVMLNVLFKSTRILM